jgi:hypothetical protein
MNCVSWYEAYAFCIWDGGFLASEAEYVYAAAGGSEQRRYPWGATEPGTTSQYAVYNCSYPDGATTCDGNGTTRNIAPVGTAKLGAGRWGHLDLVGNLMEWYLDWFAPSYGSPCKDCANLADGSGRALRDGYFASTEAALLRSSYRNNGFYPANRFASGSHVGPPLHTRASRPSMVALGTAPRISSINSGPRKIISMGIAVTWKRDARPGFSSTFSLPILIRPARSAAICSSTGPTVRQGPHHGAQKSTNTGMGQASTSCSQLLSVTVTGLFGNTFCLQAPHVGLSSTRSRKMRLVRPQCAQGYWMALLLGVSIMA